MNDTPSSIKRKRKPSVKGAPNGASPPISEGLDPEIASLFQNLEPDSPAPYSDITLANRFARGAGIDLRYVSKLGAWFVWTPDQNRWVEDDVLLHLTMLKRFQVEVAEEAYQQTFQAVLRETRSEGDAARAAVRAASALSSTSKTMSILAALRSVPSIAATVEAFDKDLWLLNTPGGVVDLKTGAMRETRREDMFSKVTICAPREMPTPVFDSFLFDIMGGRLPPEVCECAACVSSETKPPKERQRLHLQEVQALIDFQYRLYGYCLSGDTSEHLLVIEHGGGGNGKGLQADYFEQCIWGISPNGYSSEIPAEALMVQRGERHPTDLMSLLVRCPACIFT